MNKFAQMMLGGMVGALAGFFFGVLLAYLLMPVEDPRRPREHEWYGMAFMVYGVMASIAAALCGLAAGSLPTPKTIICAAAGIGIGLLAGLFVWDRGWLSGIERNSYDGPTIIIFTFGLGTAGAIAGGVWSCVRPALADHPVTTGAKVGFTVTAFLVTSVWALGLAWLSYLWGWGWD